MPDAYSSTRNDNEKDRHRNHSPPSDKPLPEDDELGFWSIELRASYREGFERASCSKAFKASPAAAVLRVCVCVCGCVRVRVCVCAMPSSRLGCQLEA